MSLFSRIPSLLKPKWPKLNEIRLKRPDAMTLSVTVPWVPNMPSATTGRTSLAAKETGELVESDARNADVVKEVQPVICQTRLNRIEIAGCKS